MQKEKLIQISFIALVAIIGIVAIYFVAAGQSAKNDDIQYPYVTTTDGNGPVETLSSTVQKIEKIEGQKATYSFNYDLTANPPIFALDHPLMGLDCSYVEYKTEMVEDTFVINESQTGDCESQPLYITTLFKDSRPFSKVKLNQLVNGEIIFTEEFEVNKEIPKTE